MHPDDRMVNALDLLSYLSEVQLSLRVARHIGCVGCFESGKQHADRLTDVVPSTANSRPRVRRPA